jgi:hypothetical protein
MSFRCARRRVCGVFRFVSLAAAVGGVPASAGTHHQQARRRAVPAKGTPMGVTAAAATFITCAAPACGARVPATESVYIDGAGQLCEACAGPLPEWAYDIELPY